jgi:hypothetical protein
MLRTRVLAAALAASALMTVPAMAQDACLRLNDVRSMDVVDNQTLMVTDRQDNAYTVRTSNVCVGLHSSGQQLTFRPVSTAMCLRPGDGISYSLPGEEVSVQIYGNTQQQTCNIGSVTAGVPG